jgi:hypothetical protein
VLEDERPPLSVVIPARDGLRGLDPVFAELLPQAREAGAQVIVSGGSDRAAPDAVRLLPTAETSILGLRLAGLRAADGELVAIGEEPRRPAAGLHRGDHPCASRASRRGRPDPGDPRAACIRGHPAAMST